MKLLTRDTDYALRALAYIATQKDKVVAVPQLMSALKMPRPFLRKILQRLTKEGLLISYKGIGGGFLLKRAARTIRLTDVINIFQGPVALNECRFRRELCPNRQRCRLKKRLDYIDSFVRSELGKIVLDDLIR